MSAWNRKMRALGGCVALREIASNLAAKALTLSMLDGEGMWENDLDAAPRIWSAVSIVILPRKMARRRAGTGRMRSCQSLRRR